MLRSPKPLHKIFYSGHVSMCITIEIENYNMVNYNMVVVGDLSEKMDIYEFMSIFIKLKVKPVLI